ncbi:RNA polymerase sigma factor [Acetoanaerobium noterae]|uniref:RNA polymerase sigma factor n=1 Tax=Acetoanaerobium noterae TaxID=745369 RepID=UPI0032217AFB
MKIKYEFVTETIEIEVSDEMAAIIEELDRLEYNNNHSETRRHTTLNNGMREMQWVACEKCNPENILEKEIESERIREILNTLSDSQKDLICKVFLQEMKAKDYAEICGVKKAAISNRLAVIRKNLKKLL